MISGTTDFLRGLRARCTSIIATAAFGSRVYRPMAVIAYGQPDGSILGHRIPWGSFHNTGLQRLCTERQYRLKGVAVLPAEHRPGIGSGDGTPGELQVTSTPKVLFHIKIRYTDVSQDARDLLSTVMAVFQDQFFTACGGAATADCTATPGTQITNDTYDCSEAGVATLGLTDISDTDILLNPNPASTSFRIIGLTTVGEVRVYDINGRLIVEEQRHDDSPIDMSAHDEGVYLVEITSGSATIIKRLIKKAE